MNKTAIKNFAVWARRKLISDITYKAGMLGITENGIAEKLPQSTNDLHFYDVGTKDYVEVYGETIFQRASLVNAINAKARECGNFKEAFEYIVEEVAYTWFNRLISIRFMEVNDYLPSGFRVLSSENPAKNEPDFVTNPFDTDLDFTPYEQDKVIQLKEENKLDELFRMLFIKQCNKLHDILPGLFEETNDYTEVLLNISFTDKDGVVYHLVHDIAEDDFNVEKEGQVEIIGWMYQYYNIEPKDKVFANLKKNIKISKENIPAATQLFTPDWIVRYMVENSLGKLWVEGHPNDAMKSQWKYYLEEAEQEPQVAAQLELIRAEHKNLTPEGIKFIDPCMGSGHILVYAFDVFMQIYESYGYTQRDAVRSILLNNIYGLDIDDRAYQLSYFAIMMKARQYNRRIFRDNITPNLFSISESNQVTHDLIEFVANGDKKLLSELTTVCHELRDAKEYGSILNITPVDFDGILSRIDAIAETYYDDIFLQDYQRKTLSVILPLIKQAKAMAQKYEVVATNPPYMGGSINNKLKEFVCKEYACAKADMFAVFIVKCLNMAKDNISMVTPDTWLFLPSYIELRNRIYTQTVASSINHLGNKAFDAGFGTVAFVLKKYHLPAYLSRYVRLVDYGQDEKADNIRNMSNHYIKSFNFYKSMPNQIMAYWASDMIHSVFETALPLSKYADARKGLTTTDNARFLRYWTEVCFRNIGIDYFNKEAAEKSEKKWFPINKGGEYRKWYGNKYYVVNWKNDGEELKTSISKKYNGGSYTKEIRSEDKYFQDAVTWNTLSSETCFRFSDYGALFNTAGSSIFGEKETLVYLLGLLNTNIISKIVEMLDSSLNFNSGTIAKIPVVVDSCNKKFVEKLSLQNVELAKSDWDSFETSWDFEVHPLVRCAMFSMKEMIEDAKKHIIDMSYIEDAFDNWSNECYLRFNQLKANEEELNRIFIEIYGLQDELTPDVEDKDVTVRKANLQREIKSLLSYAVGCMFGRYSLDIEGLAYAGGEWDDSKYTTFIPDKDNCIPITDEEYFKDDLVGLLCSWLKKVYGEDTLEENLEFIAKALGNKGVTSREVIRNYFLNDFIKDHIKTYQKRPIYWMFDSGKQNGFKALCYMHRWDADTTGNMRVEYLHRMQRVYEKEIERMQEIIDNSSDNKEIAAAIKRKEKLQKQLKESKDFDMLVAHLALSRIDIDLDDGVKINYEKVQTAPDGKKMQILTKI